MTGWVPGVILTPGGDVPEQSSITEYRLAVVEKRLEDLFVAIKEAVGQLGGQMTALQSTIVALQQDMPKSYTPRPESQALQDAQDLVHTDLDRRIRETNEHVKETNRRIERVEMLGWGLLVAVAGSLGTALLSLLRSQPGG